MMSRLSVDRPNSPVFQLHSSEIPTRLSQHALQLVADFWTLLAPVLKPTACLQHTLCIMDNTALPHHPGVPHVDMMNIEHGAMTYDAIVCANGTQK